MAKRRRKKVAGNRIDWAAVVFYVLLVAFGWMNIYAASYAEEVENLMTHTYVRQLIFIGSAFIIAFLMSLVDSKIFSFLAYAIYGLVIVLLIGVLFSRPIHNARSWFIISDYLRLQPAELAKFATTLAIAKYISKTRRKVTYFFNLLAIGSIIAVPVLLIMLQPDFGSAVVYIAFIFVLYREGLPGIFLIIIALVITLFVSALLMNLGTITLIAIILAFLVFWMMSKKGKETGLAFAFFAGVFVIIGLLNEFLSLDIPFHYMLFIDLIICLFPFIFWAYKNKVRQTYLILAILAGSLLYAYSVNYIFYKVLEPHQQSRINVFLGQEEDVRGAEWNYQQSKIAIGSGGIYGKGYLQGTQTKYEFVPEQRTDFIFCTVGEEWGFLGSLLVIGLFVALILRLIKIAERQRSAFSRIYGYGVASIIFIHLLINIGMTIGLVPIIGIPLPFLSYGGSSLWSFTILIFILLRLDINRNELL